MQENKAFVVEWCLCYCMEGCGLLYGFVCKGWACVDISHVWTRLKGLYKSLWGLWTTAGEILGVY